MRRAAHPQAAVQHDVGVSLRIFVAHPSALLTDHRHHGDGLVAYGFIRELAARGHELEIAAERVDLSEPQPANVRIHPLGGSHGTPTLGRAGFMWRMSRLYRNLARGQPFDVVHQLNPVHAGLTLALADQPVPIVLGPYVPDWPGFRKPGGPLLRPVVLRVNDLVRAAQQRRATTVLLSTPAAASKLATRQIGRLRIHQISAGIDDREWRPPEDAQQRDRQDVLFLANLEVRKGILVLLDAFADVARALPAARLVVAGGGPLATEVRERVASPSLSGVRLLGPLERGEAPAVVQDCGVCCVPSLAEPFGMTALEAMACAKPVVATAAGGLGHLVPDEGGRKVAPGDAEALAAALKELLAAPELRSAMGTHNRRLVEERYAWPRVVDRLEEAYREAVDHARTAPRPVMSRAL
jgi:glycosyltransferase involved in cell wall biosynthesis